MEEEERRLGSLNALQLLLAGIWQLAQLPRRYLALHMIVDKTFLSSPLPGG